MTRLDRMNNGHPPRPVRRVMTIAVSSRAVPRDHDQVVVTLYPHGTIGFRPLRCRGEYMLPLEYVYIEAVKARLLAELDERKKARKRERVSEPSGT